VAVVIREDRLLLVDLGRLNTDVVPLAMRIMDESATAEEHDVFAERFAAMARRLQARAAHVGLVIDGECARLALLCLALLERHKVSGKGLCRHCRTPREWWWRRSCRCAVLPVVSLSLPGAAPRILE
jgi:hypothetical protein